MKSNIHKVSEHKYWIKCKYCQKWFKYLPNPKLLKKLGTVSLPVYCWKSGCEHRYRRENRFSREGKTDKVLYNYKLLKELYATRR